MPSRFASATRKPATGSCATWCAARRPPFDPVAVTREYAALCKDYKVTEVNGDNYSAEWAVTAFKDAGVKLPAQAQQRKSDIYLERLPLFHAPAIPAARLCAAAARAEAAGVATDRTAGQVDHGRRGWTIWPTRWAVCGEGGEARRLRHHPELGERQHANDATREWQARPATPFDAKRQTMAVN